MNFCSRRIGPVAAFCSQVLIVLAVFLAAIADPQASVAETPANPDPEFSHYLMLRKAALKISRDQLPVSSSDQRDPYGVVMELSYPEAIVTLFTAAGGTAELYMSGGGEVSGGEQAKNVRIVADKFIDIAGRFASQIPPAARTPLPDKGQVRFFLLTRNGLHSKQVPEQKLAGGKDPLSPLYFAGHAVIASLRNVEATAEKKGMKRQVAGEPIAEDPAAADESAEEPADAEPAAEPATAPKGPAAAPKGIVPETEF